MENTVKEKDKAYKLILKDRMNSLQNDMESLCNDLDVPMPSAKKQRNLTICFDEEIVGKIKSAFLEGHLRAMADLGVPIERFIDSIEKEHGPLPYIDPSISLIGQSRRRKSTVDKRLGSLIRSFTKQIKLLKAECDEV